MPLFPLRTRRTSLDSDMSFENTRKKDTLNLKSIFENKLHDVKKVQVYYMLSISRVKERMTRVTLVAVM